MGPLGNLAKIRGLVTGSTDIQTPGLKLLIPLTQIEMGSNPLYHNMGSLFGLQPGTLTAATHLSFHEFKTEDYSTYSVLVDNKQQKSIIVQGIQSKQV